MGNATYIGRVATLAVAVVVVMATAAVPMPASTVSPAMRLSASSAPCTDTDVTCALIMGGTSVPTPDDFYVEAVKNQFIAPTHPGQTSSTSR